MAPLELFNSRYRAFMPAAALAARGHNVLYDNSPRADQFDRLGSFDAVFVYRLGDGPIQRLVPRLRAAGVAVIWDNDDDITIGVPLTMRARAMASQRAGSEIRRLLQLVDAASTPSEVLVGKYREGGAQDVRCLENFVADDAPRERPTRSGELVLGWTAGGEHEFDLEQLGIREVLNALLEKHPDLTIESLGVNLRVNPRRYRHIRLVVNERLVDKLRDWDIGIAPIADIPFNRARSNIKVKEYAAAGIPWLASPIGPYAGLGPRQGGRLVDDRSWFEELDRLISSKRDREKLAKRGSRWVREQTISRNIHLWEGMIGDAVERASARAGRAMVR